MREPEITAKGPLTPLFPIGKKETSLAGKTVFTEIERENNNTSGLEPASIKGRK